MSWLGFLLALAITLRMTRLITQDSLTQGIRLWVVDRWGSASTIATFLHCPWCVGWWVALAAATGSHYWATDWRWQIFGAACAASWATGMSAVWLDEG